MKYLSGLFALVSNTVLKESQVCVVIVIFLLVLKAR